jgi:hypothetical protein
MFGPKIKDITRVKAGAEGGTALLDLKPLANEANLLLGYDNLTRFISTKEQNLENVKRAAAAFEKVGIDPLDIEKVLKYKERMVNKCSQEETQVSRRVIAYWESDMVSRTSQVIPSFVLAHAVALKKELPDASFFVESLRINQERHPDPFLVMELGNLKFYVDVWEEPEFEGRRVV